MTRLVLGLVLTVSGAISLAVGLTVPFPAPARVLLGIVGLAALSWSFWLETNPDVEERL